MVTKSSQYEKNGAIEKKTGVAKYTKWSKQFMSLFFLKRVVYCFKNKNSFKPFTLKNKIYAPVSQKHSLPHLCIRTKPHLQFSAIHHPTSPNNRPVTHNITRYGPPPHKFALRSKSPKTDEKSCLIWGRSENNPRMTGE